MTRRALLIVLDSVGIGGAPDATAYGDEGADTLGHIADACAIGRGDRAGLRRGPLWLPHMVELGLGFACRDATGRVPPGLERQVEAGGAWGVAHEVSRGKDTVSGHWELAGVPVDVDWRYFPDTVPTFPPELIAALVAGANLPGILGDRHASGVEVIGSLGLEHTRSGKPICYTSADSVFQIAAHEESFGLARLYDTCLVARRLCDPLRVGRVIARPFTGDERRGFWRTPNRRDYAVPPAADTLLDHLTRAGREVVTVGKIGDIFAHRATGREIKAAGNDACLDAALAAFRQVGESGFVFTNLVEFDSEHGHRRDVPGYAAALEAFDRRIPAIRAELRPGDICIVTADHGNDPTAPGTDHTREAVPILCFGPDVQAGPIGTRRTFADVGAAVAMHLGLSRPLHGTAWQPTAAQSA